MPSGANTPEDDAPILDLERFAVLSADIESGATRDEVIAREGLSVESWTRTQESWLGKMADEASRKRFELTNRYNSAFVAQRRAADGARRPGKNKKTGARVEPAGPAAAAPALAAPPAFVAPPAAFVAPPPSFVAAPPPFVAPPPIAAPAPFVAPPAPVATPAVVAPSSIAIRAAPAPAAAAPANLGGTVAAEVISPFASGAPLPFKQGRAVIADAAPSPAKPVRPSGGKTIDGVISPFAKSATPFAKSAEPRALPPTAPTAPLAPIKPLPRPAFDPNAPMDLGGTMMASAQDPAESGNKLPFRAASDAAPRPPPAAPPPGHGLPFRTAAPAAAPAAAAPPAAATAPVAPRATRFTLEQFASLSAEIAVAPASVGQVRGRYGLDDASHRAEAEEWGRRFSADKELFARYGALFQSYRDWLARSPR
jgi:hypothetical protein